MKVAECSLAELNRHLLEEGIVIQAGPFAVNIKSNLPELPALLHHLYAHYPFAGDESFADIHVHLIRRRNLSRWFTADSARLWIDDRILFATFSPDTAFPVLEWGINWCVAMRAHQYLMLHAGVVEKNGRAVLLPAWPGSGKSTLCAALIQRGWRLLSDEFALVRPADLAIVPFPRLIPLKNESIAVIRAFAPAAVLGPEFPKTRKGTVCHLRPPTDSIARADETARASWIVFPTFRPRIPLDWKTLAKVPAFTKLSYNSFNYEKMGLWGFKTAGALIESCDCYLLQYSDLEQAIAQLDAVAAGQVS